MAMSRSEALTRCGRIYEVLGRVLNEEIAGSADAELNLDATFEELGIDDDSKKRLYLRMAKEFPTLPEEDEVKMFRFKTLRDMYNFIYNDYEESFGNVRDMQFWKFMTRRMIKYSRPAHSVYRIAFAPEEMRWDTIPSLALGMDESDMNLLRADFKNTFGVEMPAKLSVGDTFDVIFQLSAEAVNNFELLEKNSRAANKSEPTYRPPIDPDTLEPEEQTLGNRMLTAFLTVLPVLVFIVALVLIFVYIY